jgi:hypothetical protein
MSKFPHFSLIFFSILMLSACGTFKVGRDFDAGVFESKLEQGVTTQYQVRTWLGDPTNKGVSLDTDGEHFDEWTYYFAEGEFPDMHTLNMKILQIRFDTNGVVRSYSRSATREYMILR